MELIGLDFNTNSEKEGALNTFSYLRVEPYCNSGLRSASLFASQREMEGEEEQEEVRDAQKLKGHQELCGCKEI